MEIDSDLLMLYRLLANRPAEFIRLTALNTPASVLGSDHSFRIDDALRRAVERDLEWLLLPGHHLLSIADDRYPPLLKTIHDPPPVLFADGDIGCLQHKAVAMVGARKATAYGLRHAHHIAAELAGAGLMVVSGLALGIDSKAHEGALECPAGKTLAVLGTGCDVIYPRRHWRLADRIRERGLLLSEFPLRTAAFPSNFPRRNRVVTGLSAATLVIEATRQSGSLISATLAMSQGRDVLAMPGQVNQEQARGCHQLIRDGAALVENADDVLRELGMDAADAPLIVSKPRLTDEQQMLLDCLSAGPLSLDMLCEASRLSVDAITVGLVSLEIAGLVVNDAGRYQRQSAG